MKKPRIKYLTSMIIVANFAFFSGCTTTVQHAMLSDDASYFWLGSTSSKQKSIFKVTDEKVTFRVRFKPNFVGTSRSFIAEWTQPDGSIYLSQPVGTKYGSNQDLITSLPINHNEPSRLPGRWKVRLLYEGEELVSFPFTIEE